MFFGDFLIRQNLINEEDLIDALTEQLSSTPPLLKILRASGNFSSSQLIDLVKQQVESGLEIKSLLLKKSIITENELSEYLKLQNKERLPLGQILIEMGKIGIDECQEALTNYMNHQQGLSLSDGEIDLDNISEEELQQAIDKEKAEKALVIGETEEEKREFNQYLADENNNSPANEQNVSEAGAANIEAMPNPLPDFEFEEITGFVLDEYFAVFDEMKKDEMDQTILSWKKIISVDNADDLKFSFREFYRELHTLKGTVRFFRGVVSEHLIHSAEDLLAELIVVSDQVDLQFADQLEDFYLLLTDLLWKLRLSLAESEEERSLWESGDFQKQALVFSSSCANLKYVVDDLLSNRSADDVKSQF